MEYKDFPVSINLCAAANAGFELVMAVEGYKKYVKK